MTLRRVADGRAQQYWDKDRLLSHAMGEKDEDSIAWDYIAVYRPGARWKDSLPEPVASGDPVVDVIGRVKEALTSLQAVAGYFPTMCSRSLLFSWQMYSRSSMPGCQGIV